MNQIHPKSQTTRLYQHPTPENTVVYKGWVSNFFALLVVGILIGFTVYAAFIAADKEAVIKTEKQAQVRAEVSK